MSDKCLLFDLNGTLIYRAQQSKVVIRPFAWNVLKLLSKKYKIYIATSMIYKNVIKILYKMDPMWKTIITRIFDRNYTIPLATDQKPFGTLRNVPKIIQELQVDIETIVFIDNDLYKYQQCKVEVIIVPTFDGNEKDEYLNTLLEILW